MIGSLGALPEGGGLLGRMLGGWLRGMLLVGRCWALAAGAAVHGRAAGTGYRCLALLGVGLSGLLLV